MAQHLFLICVAILNACSVGTTLAYSFYHMPAAVSTRRSCLTMKRGRGSFKREIVGEGAAGSAGVSGGGGRGGGVNWIPLPIASSVLPRNDGEISVIDTNLITLKQAATNPTGAVAVARQAGQTYCFSVACPSCKIPLTKAKLLIQDGKPVLACAFCKSSYKLKTGEKIEAVEKGGILGSVVQSIFSANKESGPLAVYKLAEKNGKLLIALD